MSVVDAALEVGGLVQVGVEVTRVVVFEIIGDVVGVPPFSRRSNGISCLLDASGKGRVVPFGCHCGTGGAAIAIGVSAGGGLVDVPRVGDVVALLCGGVAADPVEAAVGEGGEWDLLGGGVVAVLVADGQADGDGGGLGGEAEGGGSGVVRDDFGAVTVGELPLVIVDVAGVGGGEGEDVEVVAVGDLGEGRGGAGGDVDPVGFAEGTQAGVVDAGGGVGAALCDDECGASLICDEVAVFLPLAGLGAGGFGGQRDCPDGAFVVRRAEEVSRAGLLELLQQFFAAREQCGGCEAEGRSSLCECNAELVHGDGGN